MGKKAIWLMAWLWVCLSSVASAADIQWVAGDFATLDRLSVVGDATQQGSEIHLVPNQLDQTGGVHYRVPFELNTQTSFSVFFEASTGPSSDTNRTEGMAFVLHGDGAFPLGTGASSLGAEGILPGYALLWDIADGTDPQLKTCQTNDNACFGAAGTQTLDVMSAQFFIWVDYDATTTTLSIFSNTTNTKPAMALVTQVVDLRSVLGDKVFLAWTAATGSAQSSQFALKQAQATFTEQSDQDLDGVPDRFDADSDGDGISNVAESNLLDPYDDADGDGIPLYLDLDRDNDMNNEVTDANNDGVDDALDLDMDGIPNHLDINADGDAESDAIEGHDGDHDGVPDAMPSGSDVDGDGLDDAYDDNVPGGTNGTLAILPDKDMDGSMDFLDSKNLDVSQLDVSMVAVDKQALLLSGSIKTTVRNAGLTAIDEMVSIRLFVDRDNDGVFTMAQDTLINTFTAALNLAPGADVELTTMLAGTEVVDFANQSIFVELDVTNVIEESNELDNLNHSAALNCAAQSDVSASRLRYDLTAYPMFAQWTVRLGNAGMVDVPANTSVAIYNGDPSNGGQLLGTAVTSSVLSAGAFEDINIISMMPPVLMPDAETIFVVVDDDGVGVGALTECDETNNTHQRTYPVGSTITTPTDNLVTNSAPTSFEGASTNGTVIRVRLLNSMDQALFEDLNVVVNMMGQWSVTPNVVLPDGVYRVVATALDDEGNVGLTTTHTFTLDTTPPAVALNQPANMFITNDNTPTFVGTGEANASVVVTIRNDQNVVVQSPMTTVDAQGDWTLDATSLIDGVYTAIATATDEAGNSADSMTITLTIDTVAPVIVIAMPQDQLVSNNDTPVISGSAEANVAIVLTIKDSNNATVSTQNLQADAQGGWTVAVTQPLADDTYTIEVIATDEAGNANTDTHTYTVDTAPPVLSWTQPVDGAVLNTATVTLEGQTEAGLSVQLTVLDGTNSPVFTQSTATDAQGRWSLPVGMMLSDGGYTARAVASDDANNTGNNAIGFVIDTTVPTISLTTPVDGAVTSNVRPAIAGNTEVNAQVTVTVRDAQNQVVETLNAVANGTGAWGVALTQDLVDGVYTIIARAVDAANNEDTTTATITVDTTALPLQITAPAQGASLNMTSPQVNGTTAPQTNVDWTLSDGQGMVVLSGQVQSDAQGDWSVQFNNVAEGDYTFAAEVINAANTTTNATRGFSVDVTPPSLSITEPAAMALLNDATPRIAGQAEAGATVRVRILDDQGNQVFDGTQVASAQGQWSVVSPLLNDGDFDVQVTATDGASNQTQQGPVRFTVDTTPPALSILTPTQDQLLSNPTVQVSGQGEDGLTVTVRLDDAQGQEVATQMTTVVNSRWSVSFMAVTNGSYVLDVSSEDLAQNRTRFNRAFRVDADEAFVTITSPADNAVLNTNTLMIEGQTNDDAQLTIALTNAMNMRVLSEQVTPDAQGLWVLDVTQMLADGTYRINAGAQRPNGKRASVTLNFTVDTTPPTVTITAPADGLVTNQAQPMITGQTEAGAKVSVAVLDDQDNIEWASEVTADAQGAWQTVPDGALADGAWSVRADATDVAGNASQMQAVHSFVVDTMAPNLVIEQPVANAQFEETKPTISGTTEPDLLVSVSVDGQDAGRVQADAQGAWSTTLVDPLAPGIHTVRATTVDGAGNMADSGDVTFTIVSPDAPVDVTSPADGDTVEGPNVTVTGLGEPGQQVTISIGERSVMATVGDDGKWSATLTEVDDGDAVIRVTDDDQEILINVTVAAPQEEVAFQGGGCQSTHGQPVFWPLLVLLMAGFWRRRHV